MLNCVNLSCRSTNPVPDELSSEVVSNHESVVESDATDLDHEDGYTPLDPHYLPPGLDDHQTSKTGDDAQSKDEDDEDAQKTGVNIHGLCGVF